MIQRFSAFSLCICHAIPYILYEHNYICQYFLFIVLQGSYHTHRILRLMMQEWSEHKQDRFTVASGLLIILLTDKNETFTLGKVKLDDERSKKKSSFFMWRLCWGTKYLCLVQIFMCFWMYVSFPYSFSPTPIKFASSSTTETWKTGRDSLTWCLNEAAWSDFTLCSLTAFSSLYSCPTYTLYLCDFSSLVCLSSLNSHLL